MSKPVPPAMLADAESLFKHAKCGSDEFQQCNPFPFQLVQGVIKPSCGHALNEGLRAIGDKAGNLCKTSGADFPSVVRMLVWELASSTLIRHFASICGTAPLIPDPYYLESGVRLWREKRQEIDGEGCIVRHPNTDLLNVVRLEILTCENKTDRVAIECLDAEGKVERSVSAGSCDAIFVTSGDFRLRYVCEQPELWASFVAYYYVNDRARPEDERIASGGY